MKPGTKLLLLGFLLICSISYALNSEYADHLMQKRRYPAAILEYERFLYFEAKDGADSLYAHEAIIRAYYGAEMYEEMWEYGENQQLLKLSPEYQRRFLSLASLRQGNHSLASLIPEVGHGANSLLLKGIAELYLGNFKEANALFQLLPDSSVDKKTLLKVSAEAARVPQKQPWLAGTLALVPGAGYLYNGKWQTAFSSLLLHALFFSSAYELQKKEMPISSAVVFSLGLGYYIGNIYGSVSETLKYNKAKREAYLDINLQDYIRQLEEAKPSREEET